MRILIALLAIAAVGAVGWSLRLSRRLRHSERDRRRAADELNRRLSELFSLQELSFILSGSLQLDRIVEQVVRYAMRFLDAQGALVALALDGEPAGEAGAGRENRPLLQVTAADGTLAALAGRAIGADDPGLVVRSLGRERLELVRSSGGEPTRLVGDVQADSAAAVPLRAHGVVVGTLVIANPRGGGFAAEDIRLLSTVATHAAIVIANARFFEMVRHAKEQWETAFDSRTISSRRAPSPRCCGLRSPMSSDAIWSKPWWVRRHPWRSYLRRRARAIGCSRSCCARPRWDVRSG